MSQKIQDWRAFLPYFHPEEFTRPEEMEIDLLKRLMKARLASTLPFTFATGGTFRAGDPKSHGRGYAVDIQCSTSADRNIILRAVMPHFQRIGVYDRHIHVDCDPDLPQNVIWWGTSS